MAPPACLHRAGGGGGADVGVHADCLGARTNGSRWAICYVPSAKENDLFRMNLWQQNRGDLKRGVTSEGPEHNIKKVQYGNGAHTLKITTVWIRTLTNVLISRAGCGEVGRGGFK